MTQKHDLSRVKSSSDIYGEDKPCRVLPSESEIFELTPGGAANVAIFPVDLWFPRDLAVTVGDTVCVRKTKVLSGARQAVSTGLIADAAVGATTVYVDDVVGFEGGDEATISDATNSQSMVIKSVDDNTVTLFDALKYSFVVDDIFEVETFYRIQSIKVPGSVGPIIQTVATACFYTGQDD